MSNFKKTKVYQKACPTLHFISELVPPTATCMNDHRTK